MSSCCYQPETTLVTVKHKTAVARELLEREPLSLTTRTRHILAQIDIKKSQHNKLNLGDIVITPWTTSVSFDKQ